DHLSRMLVAALPPGVLVEIRHDRIGDAEVEAEIEDRLIPAEVPAVAYRRCIGKVEPGVAAGQLVRGEAGRQTGDRVLVRADDYALVEARVDVEGEDPGCDRV